VGGLFHNYYVLLRQSEEFQQCSVQGHFQLQSQLKRAKYSRKETRLEEEHRLGMHHQRRRSNEKNKQFQHIGAGVKQNEFRGESVR